MAVTMLEILDDVVKERRREIKDLEDKLAWKKTRLRRDESRLAGVRERQEKRLASRGSKS